MGAAPSQPRLNLGDSFPDFSVETTKGPITWSKYANDSWAILFSHPADFTPVCTTELGRVAELSSEFEKRKCKLAALSCDDVESHKAWIPDICGYSKTLKGSELPFPIISDPNRELATKLGMIDPDEKDSKGLPMTARAVFILKPNGTLALSLLYPATTGRNFDEILRVLDSLQLTAKRQVATPVDWKQGDDVFVPPGLSNEAAKEKFGSFKTIALPSGKEYIRTTALK